MLLLTGNLTRAARRPLNRKTLRRSKPAVSLCSLNAGCHLTSLTESRLCHLTSLAQSRLSPRLAHTCAHTGMFWQVSFHKLTPTDKYMVMCTDGLTEFLTNEDIMGFCKKNDKPVDTCEELVQVGPSGPLRHCSRPNHKHVFRGINRKSVSTYEPKKCSLIHL
eukprot:486375-Prorocentrum_minimum.AAC.1